MKSSKLILIITLFFCVTAFGQTADKESTQKNKLNVMIERYDTDGNSRRDLIECPLTDEECSLLNKAEDKNVDKVIAIAEKLLNNILQQENHGAFVHDITFSTGGRALIVKCYEHLCIFADVARHQNPRLSEICIRYKERKVLPKEKP